MKKILLSMLFITYTLMGNAYDFKVDDFYYNIISVNDLTVQVTCAGEEYEYPDQTATYSGDVVIPKTVEYAGKTFSVIGINPYAFINCEIGTLTIHNQIIDVHMHSDYRNHSTGGMYGKFTNLIIEDGDTPIYCFRALVDGDVSNSVYLGREIAGVQESDIVYDRGSYHKITFGSQLTKLGSACENCDNLTEVTIPENVKRLDMTFQNCDNLKSVTALGVESITEAFNNSGIESINMPNLKYIDDSFSGCRSLKSMTVPEGVVIMSGDVFAECDKLETITLPSTLRKMCSPEDSYLSDQSQMLYFYGIFVGCDSLKEIVMCSTNPPVNFKEAAFDAMTYFNATLKVPEESVEAYKNALPWKNFVNIVGEANIKNDVVAIAIEGRDEWGYLSDNDKNVSAFLSGIENSGYNHYCFNGYSIKYLTAEIGKELTLRFTPEPSYKLTSLTVNGVNKMADVVDNEFKMTVTGAADIIYSFGYDDGYEEPEPEPTLLTIKHADNGCVKMEVGNYTTYKFYIEPSDGWSLHSATFNGEDITSQVGDDGELSLSHITEDAVLAITFQADNNMVEEIVERSNAKVYVQGENIVVAGAEDGEQITIFDEAGMQVVSTNAISNIVSIPVDKGFYIVKLKGKIVKVAI